MKQTLYPVVCFGEILWDILPSGPLPGGAPMNVAYHLKKLGFNPALISKIGLDDYGRDLLSILEKSGVSSEFINVDYEHATGLVFANPNEHNEVVYDIVFPSAWDFIELQNDLPSLVGNAEYFVFGSLTSRNKISRDTLYALLDSAKKKVLDINLRPPHFHRTSVEYLLQHADILKMNIAELDLVTGWFSEFEKTEDRMKLIQDKFAIETIIVTRGGEGVLMIDKGIIYEHRGYKIDVADTIGSGDAFLAGLLSQLLMSVGNKDALEFASAIGAFIATKRGACPEYQVDEIRTLIKNNISV